MENLNSKQLEILEGCFLQSDLEELHKGYTFEEYLTYCKNNYYDDDVTILEYLLMDDNEN